MSELSGNKNCIIIVKTIIPWGFLFLIPAVALTDISGFKLAGKSKNVIIQTKKKRMPLIAMNGIMIFIPCSLILRYLAISDNFGTYFIIIQTIELIMGLLNITLIFLNMRSGRLLASKMQ